MITGTTKFTTIEHLITGSMAKIRVRIAECEVKNGKGGAYLSGKLQDKSALISFKIWKDRKDVFDFYSTGKIIEAVVKVSTYRDELQCTIESEQFLTKTQAESYYDEIIPSSEHSLVELVERFENLLNDAHEIDTSWPTAEQTIVALRNAHLWETFRTIPAAHHIHQSYVRGLLEHSVQVAELAVASAKAVKGVNIPLVTFSALFHDIGKCSSFTVGETGLVDSISEAGMLLGHLVLGATIVPRVFRNILSKQQRLLVAHVCISHHGRYEWGSAILPAFKEALLVHNADYLDSKMKDFLDAETNANDDVISVKSWGLDRFLLATGKNVPIIVEEEADDEEPVDEE